MGIELAFQIKGVGERVFLAQPQAEAGSSVRGPASRAESNGPVVIPNRSISVLSACSAGPLTPEDQLRRESRQV